MTIYLCSVHQQGYFKVNPIHRVAFEYLTYWLPKLGNCQAFCSRLNRLTRAFNKLVEILVTGFRPKDWSLHILHY